MTVSPAEYWAGSGYGVVVPNTLILLGPETDPTVVDRLWQEALGFETPDSVIDTLLALGLRNLPSIGMAHLGEHSTHIVVRGSVLAATGATDGEPISAESALTWVEQAVPLGTSVRLSFAGIMAGDALPILTGVVRADALYVGGDRVVVDVVGTAAAAGGGEPSTEPPETLESLTPHDTPSPGATHDAPVVPVPAATAEPPEAIQAEPLETLSATDFVEIEQPSELVVEPENGDRPAAQGEPMPAPADADDDYEDLFGATRAPRPVELAAVRPAAEAEADSSPAPDAAPRPEEPESGPSQADERPSAQVTPPPPVTSENAARLISSVPGAGPGAHTGSEPDPPDSGQASPLSVDFDDEEDAELTVSRARLRGRDHQTPAAPVIGGAKVHGIYCSSGHPNPATATRCRLCESPVDPADPITMPRPVLGVLRFSTGMTVELDRSLIVGRAPRAERVSASDIPHLVAVPSPEHDISRDHLEVRLDGWHVLVKDLESTNGTVIVSPGQSPERLRAGEEVPIVPGTVVNLADEVQFVYEVR